MKRLFVFLVLVFSLVFQGNSQSQKTFVKSIPVNGSEVVLVAKSGDTQVEEWDNDYMRIVVTVDALNTNETMLKRLVTLGRYDLTTTNTDGGTVIEMPKSERTVVIQGTELRESFQYKLYMPTGTKVKVQYTDNNGMLN